MGFGAGSPQLFSLSPAVQIPLAQGFSVNDPASRCKRWDDRVDFAIDAPDDGKLRTSQGELNRLGPRQLAIVSQGVQVAASPTFPNDVILTCVGEGGDSLAITTSDFVTEIWARDFSRRLGLPIEERRVFREGSTPESAKRVFISRDNKTALIESFF